MLQKHHTKCVCQICTCTKHKCPEPEHQPFSASSTYTQDFKKHPIHLWSKPEQPLAPPLRSYSYINSTHREHYPGHSIPPIGIIPPKVKDQKTDLPWTGDSEYRQRFLGQTTRLEPRKDRNSKKYVSTNKSLHSQTTYGQHFVKKIPNKSTPWNNPETVDPQCYKFDGNTVYGTNYREHPPANTTCYRPKDSINQKGNHQPISSIYQQDFIKKQMPAKCDVESLPKISNKAVIPSRHIYYNANTNDWKN